MKDPNKTPYENILSHAGMHVSRGDGILDLKPKTRFSSDMHQVDGSDWDIEPDVGGVNVFVRIVKADKTYEFQMKRSFHTKWTVELQSVSEASDWYAYEHEDCRIPLEEKETIRISAYVKVRSSNPVKFIEGSFEIPPEQDFDFVGGPGIFLVDSDACAWTLFMDVMKIQPKDNPDNPKINIVSMGLHARLGGRGPFKC